MQKGNCRDEKKKEIYIQGLTIVVGSTEDFDPSKGQTLVDLLVLVVSLCCDFGPSYSHRQ